MASNKKEENCCDNMRAAKNDSVMAWDAGLGTCILVGEGSRVPVNHCPWCGARLAPGLYTSPAMLYRP